MRKVIIILLAFLIVGCGKEEIVEKVDAKKIAASEVQRMIEENADVKIIDVRTEVEFESGHLVGAINIPLDNIQSIDYPYDTKIIVYCQSGNRSGQALKKLTELGYTNIYDLGGIVDWKYEIVEE